MKRDGGIKNEQQIVQSFNVESNMHEIAMECYQEAFKKAGVKKKDLKNPELRKAIFDMINNRDAYQPNEEGNKLIEERQKRREDRKTKLQKKVVEATKGGSNIPPPPPMPGQPG